MHWRPWLLAWYVSACNLLEPNLHASLSGIEDWLMGEGCIAAALNRRSCSHGCWHRMPCKKGLLAVISTSAMPAVSGYTSNESGDGDVREHSWGNSRVPMRSKLFSDKFYSSNLLIITCLPSTAGKLCCSLGTRNIMQLSLQRCSVLWNNMLQLLALLYRHVGAYSITTSWNGCWHNETRQ